MSKSLTHSGEYYQNQRKTGPCAKTEDQNLQEIVFKADVQKGKSQYNTVSCNERQIDAEKLKDFRTYVSDHNFRKLYDAGNYHNIREKSQLGNVKRDKNQFVHEVAYGRGQNQNECRGKPHSRRGAQLFGYSDERTDSEESYKYKIINDCGT